MRGQSSGTVTFMSRGKRKGPGTPPDAEPFHNPFAALASKREALPSTTPQVRGEDFPQTPPPDGPELAVLRLEQRGGQEVTVVEGLGLPPPELRTWMEALQRGLGCHGEVVADTLVMRGDHRRTAPDLLLRRGVKRVRQG